MILAYPKERIRWAFATAILSDLISVWITFVIPVQLAVDIVTALILFGLLGWRWIMLPALIAEALPLTSVFPCWFLVVLSLAVVGKKLSP